MPASGKASEFRICLFIWLLKRSACIGDVIFSSAHALTAKQETSLKKHVAFKPLYVPYALASCLSFENEKVQIRRYGAFNIL